MDQDEMTRGPAHHLAAMAIALAMFGAAYNLSRLTHELGHAAAAMIDGAGVERIAVHPLSWSGTTYAETPGSPMFVLLAGSLAALAVWAAIAWAARGRRALFGAVMVVAIVTWLREGVYLAVDGLAHGGGDGSDLIAAGLPAWALVIICALIVSVGLVMWRRLILSPAWPRAVARALEGGRPARMLVLGGGAGAYLAAVLIYNLITTEQNIFWFAYVGWWFVAIFAGVLIGEPWGADHPIILFDGECNLCCGSVRFIIKRDPAGRFRFASLQSDAGRALLEGRGMKTDDLHTIVLVDGDHVHVRSAAVLRIAGGMRRLWPIVAVLLIVPRFVRDGVYRFIARRRYRWFGKRETCMVPTDELRRRFVE